MQVKQIDDYLEYNDNKLTKKVLFSTKDQLCFVLNFKKGQSLPIHRHENSSLILNVISGTGEISINNDIAKISEGSVVMAQGQDDFGIPSITEDMSAFIVISPNPTNPIYSKNVD